MTVTTTQDLAGVWTIDAVRKLPATVDIETAGAVLGIGRSKSYELAKAGEFPVRVLRIGRRYLVPTNLLLKLLGVDDDTESGRQPATA
ncbi:helix-turn-helix domain-containing protein [Dactylosporangium sp. NBC_01737]|uniref:DNA-binding protein n=1 Tax=Dactylosporangium sp. NBC_01737 TaxID=2975959 RepID=UPI002E15372E|nr:helix-turn-helix domain-containing protein [Dactylosporangium sp. NBC_01737]